MSPRARDSDVDILEATLDVIAEHGVSASTSTRSRRGPASARRRSTVTGARARGSSTPRCRRWKAPYVETDPVTPCARTSRSLLSHLVDYFNRPDIGRVFPSFIDAAVRDPELAELHQETMRRARASFEQVVRRGIERGELPADVDVDLFVDVVRAPFIYRRVVAQSPVQPDDIDAVLDLVLGAFSRVPN